MKKEDIIQFAAALPGAVCDYPFREERDIAVLRHADNQKWFAVLLAAPKARIGKEGKGSETVLDVKCPPDLLPMLCNTYAGILPGYHMNKKHWITVRLDGSVPDEEIEKLVRLSYDITSAGNRKRK